MCTFSQTGHITSFDIPVMRHWLGYGKRPNHRMDPLKQFDPAVQAPQAIALLTKQDPTP